MSVCVCISVVVPKFTTNLTSRHYMESATTWMCARIRIRIRAFIPLVNAMNANQNTGLNKHIHRIALKYNNIIGCKTFIYSYEIIDTWHVKKKALFAFSIPFVKTPWKYFDFNFYMRCEHDLQLQKLHFIYKNWWTILTAIFFIIYDITNSCIFRKLILTLQKQWNWIQNVFEFFECKKI